MKDSGAISAYQQSSARGASAVGLIVALYDTILRDFRRALEAFDAGNVEIRVSELNHALTVIAHLKNVLDHEKGGEAAAYFARFYEVTRRMIVDVNLAKNRSSLLDLIDLYTSLRQAWQEADRQLSFGPPAAAAPRSAAPAVTPYSSPSPASAADLHDAPKRSTWSA